MDANTGSPIHKISNSILNTEDIELLRDFASDHHFIPGPHRMHKLATLISRSHEEIPQAHSTHCILNTEEFGPLRAITSHHFY